MFGSSRILTVVVTVVITSTSSAVVTADILPAASGNVALWYNTDAFVGYADGTLLSSWTDLSGHYNLTQSNSSYQPKVRTDSDQLLNGCPTVRFDGSNDWMSTAAFSSPLAQADHVFVVVNTYDSNPTLEEYVFDGYTSARQNFNFFGANSSVFAGAGPLYGSFTATSVNIHEICYNGADSYWCVNGDVLASGEVGSSSLAQLLVGARSNNGSDPTKRYLKGTMGSLIFFDRELNSTERNQIGVYLADKYGLETSYVVPEPSGCALLLGALLGLMAYAWRKRR